MPRSSLENLVAHVIDRSVGAGRSPQIGPFSPSHVFAGGPWTRSDSAGATARRFCVGQNKPYRGSNKSEGQIVGTRRETDA